MKSNGFYDLLKYKKLHASIIGIIIFIILIRILGVKFFLVDLVYDNETHYIDTKSLYIIMKKLFFVNVKNIILIYFVLGLKHGERYKYVIITVLSMVSMFVFVNVFCSCKTVGNLIAMLILYLPKYLNYFVYIYTVERIQTLARKYKCSQKISEELKNLFKIIVIVISVALILSGIQTILALMAV